MQIITLREKPKKIIIHLFCWLFFILYEEVYILLVSGKIGPVFDIFYFYGCNICLYYFHYALLRRTFSIERPGYIKLAAGILLETCIFLLVKSWREYYLVPGALSFSEKISELGNYMVSDLLRNIYFIGLATLIFFTSRASRLQKESAEARIREMGLAAEKSQLEAVYAKTHHAYLQQQLNPHLLFNTLSFIHYSVFRHSAEGGRAVMLLSEIMRFSLSPTDTEGKIPLPQEMEQIKNLIDLNQFRYDYPIDVSLSVQGDPDGFRIIPLILLTITENIFKHADLRRGGSYVDMAVTKTGQLSFKAGNPKNQSSDFEGRKAGIGLVNTRLRLDYAYKDAYMLTIDENPDFFKLSLSLQL